MPRIARATAGGLCYHILNRGNGRARVFHKDADYQAFIDLIAAAGERTSMRVLGYCLMPNHFHLMVRPFGDDELSAWMQWLMTSHVRRYHAHHHSSGHHSFVQADDDTALEIRTREWRFAYWKTTFADSPAPEILLDLREVKSERYEWVFANTRCGRIEPTRPARYCANGGGAVVKQRRTAVLLPSFGTPRSILQWTRKLMTNRRSRRLR